MTMIQKPKELEKIKKPQELLEFMSDNLSYGFIKRSDGKILKNRGDKEWQDSWLNEYFLQKPEELLKNKFGVCWDYIELERSWFESLGYEVKTFYMAVIRDEGSKLPTHTFLAYYDNNKWYWFEYSWYNERGIREYESLEKLIRDANEKHTKSLLKEGASPEDVKNHKVYEYKNAPFGASPIDFVKHVIKKDNQQIIK
jgi:catalase